MERDIYQSSIRKWLENTQQVQTYAITLTLKQKKNNLSIDIYTAQKTMKNFLTRISRELLGNKHKKKFPLQRIPSYETKGRLHYHLLIDLPEKNLEEVEFITQRHWNPSVIPVAYNETKVKHIYDCSGWLNYITKFEKRNDDIDVLNTYVGQHYAQNPESKSLSTFHTTVLQIGNPL